MKTLPAVLALFLALPAPARAELEAQTLLRALDAHKQGVSALALAPLGGLLASGGADGGASLWPSAGEKPPLPASSSTSPVVAAAVSPDGRIAAFADAAGTLSFYAAFKGALQSKTTGLGEISSLGFSEDGRDLLAALPSGALLPFSLVNFQPGKPLASDLKSPVTALRHAQDRLHFVTGHADGSLQYWSTSLGKPLKTFKAHGAPILAIAFTPDDKYFCSAAQDGSLKFWSPEGELKKEVPPGGAARSAAFSEKTNYAVLGGMDGKLRFLRLPQGDLVLTLDAGPGPALAALSQDDKLLATGDGAGKLKAWKNPFVYRQYQAALALGDKSFAANRFDMAIAKYAEAAGLFQEPEAVEKLKKAREAKQAQLEEGRRRMQDAREQLKERMRRQRGGGGN